MSTSFIRRGLFILAGCVTTLTTTSTWALTQAERENAVHAAVEAMHAAQVVGPADVKLKDQATLHLPKGYVWVPEPAAGQFMQAIGNTENPSELGVVFPQGKDMQWMIVAEFNPAGYIKDDDAKDWDVDGLYDSLKSGTQAANEMRREHGYTELELVGWVQKPTYTATNHQLIWSVSARDKGATADAPSTLNYNTYALGREGYITLNLITDNQHINQDKQHATSLLAALDFDGGKRYADFNKSTDKVAEYGLAALVGGIAAKKLGFFALAAGFFAKFAKVILLAGMGVMAAISKLFKKKSN